MQFREILVCRLFVDWFEKVEWLNRLGPGMGGMRVDWKMSLTEACLISGMQD
jgi:hypothetical protein